MRIHIPISGTYSVCMRIRDINKLIIYSTFCFDYIMIQLIMDGINMKCNLHDCVQFV